MKASEDFINIVRNSSGEHYEYINPSMTNNMWIAAAAQMACRMFGPLSLHKQLEHLDYPCPIPASEVRNGNIAKCLGPHGFLRSSQRVTKDNELSTAQEVIYKHDRRQPIPLGEVMNLEITLWPMEIVFSSSEGIMLRMAGYDMCHGDIDKTGI